jgi:hypothetical protein
VAVTVDDGGGVTVDGDIEVDAGVVVVAVGVAGLDEQAAAANNSTIAETRTAIHRFRYNLVFILDS